MGKMQLNLQMCQPAISQVTQRNEIQTRTPTHTHMFIPELLLLHCHHWSSLHLLIYFQQTPSTSYPKSRGSGTARGSDSTWSPKAGPRAKTNRTPLFSRRTSRQQNDDSPTRPVRDF